MDHLSCLRLWPARGCSRVKVTGREWQGGRVMAFFQPGDIRSCFCPLLQLPTYFANLGNVWPFVLTMCHLETRDLQQMTIVPVSCADKKRWSLHCLGEKAAVSSPPAQLHSGVLAFHGCDWVLGGSMGLLLVRPQPSCGGSFAHAF